MLDNPREQRAAVFILPKEIYPNQSPGYGTIPRLLRYIDRQQGLILLSKICWLLEEWGDLDLEAQRFLISELIDEYRQNRVTMLVADEGRTIFFRPQLLILMKYLAVYGRDNKRALRDAGIKRIGLCLVTVTALIDAVAKGTDQSLPNDDPVARIAFRLVTSSYHVRGLDIRGIKLSLVRARHLFIDIHRSLGEAEPDDYLDIEKHFLDATGVELSHYLGIGLGIIVHYLKFRNEVRRLPEDPTFILLRPAQVFSNAIVDMDMIEKVFDLLAISLPEFVRVVEGQNRRERTHDFLAMKRKPLLQFDERVFLPFSLDFLFDRLTLGVYWIILDHLNASCGRSLSDRFTRYNGQLFQNYVTSLVEELVKRPVEDDEKLVLDRLYTVDKEQFRTPDVVLFGADYAILIEASATRLQAKRTTALGFRSAFEDDCEKMIFHNARSLDTFVGNLMSGAVEFEGVSTAQIREIYPLIVTIEGFPKHSVISAYLEDIIRDRGFLSQDEIVGLSIMEIQDLENLEDYSESPLINALRAWHVGENSLIPGNSFSDVLSSLPAREAESAWIGEITTQAFDESARLIFGREFQDDSLDNPETTTSNE